MPPKNKKEVKKIQKAAIEDKTFGLKNKNKSKVVQNFVAQVTKNAAQAGMSREELHRQEMLKKEREAKKQQKVEKEKEQVLLFNPAAKKKLEKDAQKKKEAEMAAKAAEGPEIISSEEAYLDAKRASDLSAAEAVLGPQADDDIYDAIEKERAELKKGKLTPVTFDSFVEWKARKAEEKKKKDIEDTKKAIQAASKMKGKSGRDMFNALIQGNADLFLDDDDADDDWMKRDKDSDDEEDVYDVEVTGTSLSLKRVEKPGENAQAKGEAAAKGGDAGETLAAGVDAALFLDEDVELPSDDEDE
mmetsp:Transcript_67960/g.167869  ORF Transcript_67960/g.167869 Transcript_67960/m.167869 type:complete len:302 (+) Transcript_67960:297-1202(+)